MWECKKFEKIFFTDRKTRSPDFRLRTIIVDENTSSLTCYTAILRLLSDLDIKIKLFICITLRFKLKKILQSEVTD